MSGAAAEVTVVIPVWDDYVEFLGDAVESVRRNAPGAPIVVVDNASRAAVPELEDCEIVRSAQRLSEGAARNLGLQCVNTAYVVFLDADDMLLDGALEFMHGRIAADPGLAVSATSILDSASGRRYRLPRRFASTLTRWPRAFALAGSVWSLLPIQGCAMLRTAQVRATGGYSDTDLGEDWDLAVLLAWRGRVEISERLGRFYRSPENSVGRRTRSIAELRTSARRIRDRMRRDPAVPRWARSIIPLIAVLQLVIIYLARPAYRAARALIGARP